MKNFFCLLLLSVSILSCAQEKRLLSDETDFQRELNAEYKDATKSPLLKKDLKNFKGLDFFKYDSSFVVTAELKLTAGTKFLPMETTTNRVSLKRIYGVLSFKLKDIVYNLNVYQGKELMKTEGYEDYLFLPFSDITNGDQTYGGGRYIDLRIPKENLILLDFNKAYNPYCAYNPKYSCPIVPLENSIEVKVEAGVKAYHKH